MPARTTASKVVGTSAILGCAIVLAVTGCGHSDTGATRSGPHPTPSITAGMLLIGLHDVRRITGVSTLAPAPGPNPSHQPSHFEHPEPPPCKAVFDQRTVFDRNWRQFVSTTDAATVDHGAGRANSIADVIQAIGVYADETAARGVFSQLKAKLVACRGLNVPRYDYSIDDSDPSALVLSTQTWTVVYRVKSAVLLNVVALGVDQPEPIARTLAQTVNARIG